MENGVDNPGLARWLREPAVSAPSLRRFLALALGSLLLLSGCGLGGHTDRRPASLIVGRRAALIPRVQLAAAISTTRRFAVAYARSAYARRPPHLPDATPAVQGQVEAAAAKVPPPRRQLRPRLVGFDLRPSGKRKVAASARVSDGIFPSFDVGFLLRETKVGWTVVSVSLPE